MVLLAWDADLGMARYNLPDPSSPLPYLVRGVSVEFLINLTSQVK